MKKVLNKIWLILLLYVIDVNDYLVKNALCTFLVFLKSGINIYKKIITCFFEHLTVKIGAPQATANPLVR